MCVNVSMAGSISASWMALLSSAVIQEGFRGALNLDLQTRLKSLQPLGRITIQDGGRGFSYRILLRTRKKNLPQEMKIVLNYLMKVSSLYPPSFRPLLTLFLSSLLPSPFLLSVFPLFFFFYSSFSSSSILPSLLLLLFFFLFFFSSSSPPLLPSPLPIFSASCLLLPLGTMILTLLCISSILQRRK